LLGGRGQSHGWHDLAHHPAAGALCEHGP
jgi:hypothetical protein